MRGVLPELASSRVNPLLRPTVAPPLASRSQCRSGFTREEAGNAITTRRSPETPAPSHPR
ncbi:hypothetical protein EQ845_21650 [Pseudomonas putida]|nr:hypothetical protein EQ845_21650 [Pseudomonas putida]